MATTRFSSDTKLIVKVETGVDAKGNATYSNRNLSAVNPEIVDEDARIVAAAFGALQKYPVSRIVRQDTAVLEEE